MIIEPTNLNIKCDMMGCKNKADYAIYNRKPYKIPDMHFCKDCLDNIYSAISKLRAPKSPENIMKKIKIKEK